MMGRELRAEWTKFRTVRGWVSGMAIAVLITMGIGLLFASASTSSCSEGPKEVPCPTPILGPDGLAVDDAFYFVHQPMAGDGGITVRVTSMTGIITHPPPDHNDIVKGLVPWAKAGIIIKQSTQQGSPYAAVLLTGGHGVRMQHNFTGDTAGRAGGVSAQSPRWLRLTRAGDTLTGYESVDGNQWSRVGTADLTGFPATVQVGLFVNSPGDLTASDEAFAGSTSALRFTQTTAVFDNVTLSGTPGTWSQDNIGRSGQTDWERKHNPPGLVRSGDTFTISGSGDIAPAGGGGLSGERTLIGALIGLIAVIVVAVLFITAEYRRGLIRTTLMASPRRGRVLAAKATVIGTVTFVAGLVGATVTLLVGTRIQRGNGVPILPLTWHTELRVIVGTAALLAVSAVFALALGAWFRRSAAAVIVAIGAILVPYLLAIASLLPLGVAQWLLRLTPAAGFAIQQTQVEYPQVPGHYSPVEGYFPLAPWAGFAVLCCYAALALALAMYRLRRRDA